MVTTMIRRRFAIFGYRHRTTTVSYCGGEMPLSQNGRPRQRFQKKKTRNRPTRRQSQRPRAAVAQLERSAFDPSAQTDFASTHQLLSMRITSRLLLPIIAIGLFTVAANAAEPKEPLLVGLQFDGKFEKEPKLTFHPHTVYPPFLIEKKVSGDAKIMFHLTAQGFV